MNVYTESQLSAALYMQRELCMAEFLNNYGKPHFNPKCIVNAPEPKIKPSIIEPPYKIKFQRP